MEYAKLENEQVTQVGLPMVGVLTQTGFEGCQVSGYNTLPYISDSSKIPSLKAEGWLPFIDSPPIYNPETEYLEHAGYTVGETEVVVNYLVKQIVPVVVVPTVEERLSAMEEALLMII